MREIEARIDRNFTHHVPSRAKAEELRDMGEEFKALALWMAEREPESRELSLALTSLEQANMWFNAAVVRNQ